MNRANGIYCGIMVIVAVVLIAMFGVQSFRVTTRSWELERENERLEEEKREAHAYAQELEGLNAASIRLAKKLNQELEDCRQWKQRLAGIEE